MTKTPTYAVLFRTHVWDAFVRKMAAHLHASVGRGDFFVIADETRGALDVAPYRKIAHDRDFADLGIGVNYPGPDKYLWFNGDYPLYRAIQAQPDYDYYCMVEYDAIVNQSLQRIIERIAARGIDVVGHRMRPAPPNFARALTPYFDNTNNVLACVFIASKRAVAYLLEERRRIAAVYMRNPELGWPFGESFMGAAITANPGLRYAELREFADLSRYEYWPPYLYKPELVRKANDIIHPVLDPERFLVSRLRNGADEFFEPGSKLRRDLADLPADQVSEALTACFERRQETHNLARLAEHRLAEAARPPADSLAEVTHVPQADWLSALDDQAVAAKLTRTIRVTVERVIFGRRQDSFDVDRLARLTAGITSSSYALAKMTQAKRCDSALDLLTFATSQITLAGLHLEFGVFSGRSINHLAGCCPRATLYGFDSFAGLPENWRPGFPKGAFAVEDLPEVADNVELIKGWFDDTLPPFRAQHAGETIAFLHVDCDLYSSTATIFSELGDAIVPGTIIVFDEYFNYPGWEQHEIKAFSEFCSARGVGYTYIGLVAHHQQVAVRIV